MMGIVNPYRYLLNVERTFVTLFGYAAAITFVTTVRIFGGQSKGTGTTSVAFRSLDVSLTFAATGETQSATGSSFVAIALRGIIPARAITGSTTSRISLVSGFASFAIFPGSMVGAILQDVKSITRVRSTRSTTLKYFRLESRYDH